MSSHIDNHLFMLSECIPTSVRRIPFCSGAAPIHGDSAMRIHLAAWHNCHNPTISFLDSMRLRPKTPNNNPDPLNAFLTCHLCFESIEKDLKICINGHKACSACWARCKECRFCREPTTNLIRLVDFDDVSGEEFKFF